MQGVLQDTQLEHSVRLVTGRVERAQGLWDRPAVRAQGLLKPILVGGKAWGRDLCGHRRAPREARQGTGSELTWRFRAAGRQHSQCAEH